MLRRSTFRFTNELFGLMQTKIKTEKEKVGALLKKHGNTSLGDATIDACYHGSRGITTMVYEPSLLDAQEGIRFRGLSIPECQQKLPKFPGGNEMQPEGMLWLLLTGDVPNEKQVRDLTNDLARRVREGQESLDETFKAIDAMPKELHPMNQLVSASSVLGRKSIFAYKYHHGMKKGEYWNACLEDSLNLIAYLPAVCAKIFQKTYRGTSSPLAPLDSNLDWTGNFVKQLGFDPAGSLSECLRLYMSIHVDHEGGNVSAHTVQLVGSALSDPYLSFAGGMAGLAGPLHGLANQEVLTFLKGLFQRLEADKLLDAPREKRKEAITKYTWDVLNAGQVIPGYGHAVLRKTDPRYMCQREFALKTMSNFPLFQLVDVIYEIMPGILDKHGKTKNPYPNVDAHSGVLLQYYGLKEEDFYTVLFGMSRALGVLSALVWNRALGWPIERPKSVTTEWLLKKYKL